ncbi:MAG: hypothetical protein LC708_00985, partial [Actinobacteria bacterium]|nr:hypothetical protein [Actinomycetota bacterium]
NSSFGGGTGGSDGGGGGGGAGMGGAIFNDGGVVKITNSTFTGNRASGGTGGTGGIGPHRNRPGTAGKGLGGALFSRNGPVTVTNGTFSLNTAGQGGRGIFLLGDNAQFLATINNTIIGQSDTAVSDLAADATGVGGGKILGGTTDLIRTATYFGVPANLGALTADPMLGPLQNNGGRTWTMALRAGSPAINAGTAAGAPGSDQRGVARVGTPDIGAYEYPGAPQAISFGALANRTYGDADFAISAMASSHLPVSFTASGNASVHHDAGGQWYVHITGAGGATITAHQAGNGDYAPAPAVARSFTIAKAASVTTTVGAGPFTYNGGAHAGGSGTVTGAGGLDTGATSLTYSAHGDGTGVADRTNAGTYYVTAHYAGDANHTPSSGAAVAIVIGKAHATVNVSGYTGVYNAAYHGATGSDSGVGGEDAGTLDLGASFKNVPGGIAHWVFTGNRNYTDQS